MSTRLRAKAACVCLTVDPGIVYIRVIRVYLLVKRASMNKHTLEFVFVL